MEKAVEKLAKDWNASVSSALKQLPGFRDAERLRILKAAAENGEAQSQFDLGISLVTGQYGQKVNKKAGCELLTKAANQGNVDAMSALASNVLSDVESRGDALTWLRRAAESGHVQSQHDLAVRFQAGDGVERDPAAAVRWHTLAAESGHATSQFMLAEALIHGEGAPKSPTEAERWLEKSADSGYAPASYQLEALKSPPPTSPSSSKSLLSPKSPHSPPGGISTAGGNADETTDAWLTTPERVEGKRPSKSKKEGKGKNNPAAAMMAAMMAAAKTFKMPGAAESAPAASDTAPATDLAPPAAEPAEMVKSAPRFTDACYGELVDVLGMAAKAAGFITGFGVHLSVAVLDRVLSLFSLARVV